MKFVFSADEAALEKFLEELEDKIAKAKEGAVKDAAAEALKLGRANIASAGFSSRWQSRLQMRFYPNRETGDPAAIVYHRVGFAGVFERGATIRGKPLLWLPVGAGLGRRARPSRFRGQLVSVNVGGKRPMLFDKADRGRGPLFIGVPSVTIRKRWNLKAIYEDIKERLGEFFEARMKSSK